jgi:hypothetical protein
MTEIIVEQSFDPPLTSDVFARQAARLEPCLDEHGVNWVRSYMAVDRRRLVCHYEAVDAEVVRAAFRAAGTRFDRVWLAEIRRPGSPPLSDAPQPTDTRDISAV